MNGIRPPDISLEEISRPEESTVRLVSKDEFDESKKRLEKSNRWITGLLIAVLLVCFLAVIALLIDAWYFHATTVREFAATLREMEDELRDSQLSSVNARMDRIEKALLEEKLDLTGLPD
ncbi:hypothetical protein KAR02_11065 [Candidatus Bipolaricaulota bacterium]|nr:hypothetical protein [Candidatus Bipolaricaulota bacterium]